MEEIRGINEIIKKSPYLYHPPIPISYTRNNKKKDLSGYNYMKIYIWVMSLSLILNFTACNYVKAMFYIEHMETDERLQRMDVGKVVDSLDIRPGWEIADVGAGSGLFTRAMAEKIKPDGVIYAVDINRDLLEHIEKSAAESGIKNIKTALADENDPRIPQKVDLIFICDTFHYVKNHKQYIKTLSAYLKDRGVIAMIDYKKNWPPLSEKFAADELIGWMNDAGLKLSRSYDFIEDEFFMIFVK